MAKKSTTKLIMTNTIESGYISKLGYSQSYIEPTIALYFATINNDNAANSADK